MKRWLHDTAVSRALLIFITLRLFFSGWAIVANLLSPVPTTPDEGIRPYLGEPQLSQGVAGLLLGPWQRFDTQHYLRIARQGYADESDSVFPPLYPWLVRGVSALGGGGPTARLAAALLIANLATCGLFILLHKVVTAELGPEAATRTLVYLAVFPTSFFLFSAYTESLFLLLALGSFWAGKNGRFPLAGLLGFLAAATRLTGWVLVVPLAYFAIGSRLPINGNRSSVNGNPLAVKGSHTRFTVHRLRFTDYVSRITDYVSRFTNYISRFTVHDLRFTLYHLLCAALPGLALVLFMAYRWWLGLPPLPVIYERYWYQTTGFPGQDIFTAVNTLCCGGAARSNEPFQLTLDLACTLLLLGATYAAFRRLGVGYGLYALLLLVFMLLPTSPVKPLYSFSRYALAFFPLFMLLGVWGQRPLLNRLILYPSLMLALFCSGQFFIWGWVA